MKYLFFVVFNVFLFSPSLASQDGNERLDPAELVVTHITHHFPQNGIMIPSMTKNTDHGIPDQKKQPNPRVTLHWYAFNTLPPHALNDSSQAQYAIIERGSEITSRFIGGFFEDLFMIGPHKLSPRSIILAPNGEIQELTSSNPSYQGTLIGYQPENETATKAALRIFDEWQLNPKQIKLIPTKGRIKITQEQGIQIAVQLQFQANATGACLIRDGADIFLEEEATPQKQIISVNGKKIKARDYFISALLKNFQWSSHKATCFGQFEEVTVALFSPLLYREQGIPYTTDEMTRLFPSRDDFLQMAGRFTQLYTEITGFQFQGLYAADEPLFKDYIEKWKNNIRVWYGIAQLQANSMRTKPFAETPYGNPDLLAQEIEKLKDQIQIFTAHGHEAVLGT